MSLWRALPYVLGVDAVLFAGFGAWCVYVASRDPFPGCWRRTGTKDEPRSQEEQS